MDTINPQSFIEQILFSTLKIEILDENNNPRIGTGFLLKVDFPENPNESLILLVSNKHVLKGGKELNITFHRKRKDSNFPELGQTLSYHVADYKEVLFFHPNPKIDLACLNISTIISQLATQIYFKFLDKTTFANFTESELDAGQRVIFIGYPENRYDQKHNLPVVRGGITASHPKLNYNGEEQFLIDAQVFPGSSGSPVFFNMKEAQYNRGQIILGGGPPYLFIGIVSATMIRNNIVSPLPTNLRGVSQEVIGLGLVFKATALNELIDTAIQQTHDKVKSKK
ncbi:MAG: S1 family peptidase [Candidatus Nealsonbacteria bacterium]